MIGFYIKGIFAIIFALIGVILWMFSPIIVSIYLRNGLYLFTYIISWIPSSFFFGLAQALMED